jgi:hypothetical protein
VARSKRKRRGTRPPQQQQRPAEPTAPSGVAEDDAGRATSARRKAAPGGPPPAPWGSFPLSEIVIFIAILLFIGGFFVEAPRGAVMLGAGLVLGSLAGLELAVREHFAGYKSHTTLLAGAVGMIVLGVLFVTATLAPVLRLVAAAVAFGIAAYLLASLFRRRSGGALFKVKG